MNQLYSVKPKTVPVVPVAEGSFNKFCDPGCPRGVLLRINLPIFLAMLKHECCFAGENFSRLIMQCMAWHYHAERYHQ